MQRQTWLVCVSAVMLALPACGDDDLEPGDGGADSGDSQNGGKGGESGKAGSGGASGKAGSGGKGGAAGKAGSGTSGAEDDARSGKPKYKAIQEVSDHVFTSINDLRGLTFAKNGKIYASGHTDADATNRKLVLARFEADGSPDTSFDGDGIVVYDVAPGDEQSLGLAELANGDLVVQANVSDGKGGAAIPDMAGGADGTRSNGVNVWLLRFDSTGKIVSSFGSGGKALVTFGWTDADDASWPVPTYNSSLAENMRYSTSGFPSDQAWGVVLDHSGSEEKLVVSGFGPARKASMDQRYDNDRYVARLLASTGAPDPAWNNGAAYTVNTLGTFSDGGRRAIVEKDGTVISAGYTNFGAGLGNHVVLLRLQPNGTPDPAFGFGIALPGTTRFNPFVDDGGVAECYAVGRQSKGRYITTGYGRATAMGGKSRYGYLTTDQVDLVSFAVKPDGTGVDTSWGNQGTQAIQSEERNLGGTEDRGRDLIVLPDDRVVQAGRFGVHPSVFVTTPEGTLDKDQSDDGVFTYDPFPSMPSHFFAIALSQDKRRIVAGTNTHANGALLVVLEVAAD